MALLPSATCLAASVSMSAVLVAGEVMLRISMFSSDTERATSPIPDSATSSARAVWSSVTASVFGT